MVSVYVLTGSFYLALVATHCGKVADELWLIPGAIRRSARRGRAVGSELIQLQHVVAGVIAHRDYVADQGG